MNSGSLTRLGVVRTARDGFNSIEVSAACSGCAQVGCLGRRSVNTIHLPGTAANPGDRVRLTVSARRLNAASLATFGPPIGWALLVPLAGLFFPAMLPAIEPFGPLLFVCGMVGTLAVAGWLGRRAADRLAIRQEALQPRG